MSSNAIGSAAAAASNQQDQQAQAPAAAAAAAAALPAPMPAPGGGGAAAQQQQPSHSPSLAGSVLETPNGLGGTCVIRIQNMSSTCNLGVRLDLKQIALKCRNTEFNPRRFAAVIMRLREPRATALIFASGKMCVTGTKSTHNSALAARKFAYIVERVGFKPQTYIDFKVQNIVGTADVGFPIRLEGLVYAHSTFCSFEPELFPGLIYRLVSPRVVFLIFVSGKIVITGAKTEQDLSEALTKLYPVLMEYRKANVAPMPGLASAPPALPNTSAADAGDALEMAPLPGAGGSVPMLATTDGERQREVEDV
mmetsp:Transcript_10174/g.24007  ORF Transcript_10174/g.24007 Transcript_10174/m.24007 type:complete len:309 (-) Transcript_10174:165-1091(-)